MSALRFDRTAEDLGNIVNFGHLNLTVPDQLVATKFYITALGLTRDPYMNTGTNNMWVNVGRSQFHLPTAERPQRLRGTIGLVMPELDALEARLRRARAELDGTAFSFERTAAGIGVTGPWGNQFAIYAPDRARFGPAALAFASLEMAVARGAAPGIARFYREVVGATSRLDDGIARVHVGEGQWFVFREADDVPASDGHHVQIYITNFSGPYDRLRERGLITEESNQHQYRFTDIVDPASGDVCYVLDHEVRSATHPMFARPLVNRNPALTNAWYVQGYEDATVMDPGTTTPA